MHRTENRTSPRSDGMVAMSAYQRSADVWVWRKAAIRIVCFRPAHE